MYLERGSVYPLVLSFAGKEILVQRSELLCSVRQRVSPLNGREGEPNAFFG